MNTGELTFWNSGVWLIPLFLFATVGGLYLLVRYWRNKTTQDLKNLRSGLRDAHTKRGQMALALRNYSGEQREPFASRLGALNSSLAQIDQSLADLERRHVEIHERMRHLAANQWQATVGAPFFWYSLRRDVAGLRQDLASLQTFQDSTTAQVEELSGLGWQIANQASQIQTTYSQAKESLDFLRSKNVHGDAFESAARQEAQARAALAQIPAYFFSNEQTLVLERAEPDAIARSHAVLNEIQPVVEELNLELEAWEKRYAQAVEQANAMRQRLDQVEQMLENAPSGLNLSPQRSRLEQMNVISENLQATLTRLELESLEEEYAETQRLDQAAQEIGEQIQQARQQRDDLERVLDELSQGLKELSTQFADLGTSQVHPVVWGESRIKLTHLSRQASAIGSIHKQRTPQQISSDLESATRLNQQQKELSQHCQHIGQQHQQLLETIHSPEMQKAPEWITNVEKLVEKTQAYAPENWPRADAVAKLPEHLQYLAQGLKLLVSGNPAESIPEKELDQRLEDTRELESYYRELRQRVQNIQKRLAEIQRIEKASAEKLASAKAALNQTALLVRSNALLAEEAGAEIERLQSRIDQLSRELDQPEQSALERKAQAANALLARIEQAGLKWLGKLNQALEEQRQALASKLTQADAVAPLDEPSVAEARRLLAAGQMFSNQPSQENQPIDFGQLVLELKRRSEYWQKCSAARMALQDSVDPLLEMYEAVSHNRRVAKEQFNEVAAWLRSARHWPPTSASLQSEEQELAQIEEQWQAIKQGQHKAMSLVAQLGTLDSRYQTMAGNVRRTAERAGEEMDRVEKIEAELDEVLQLWHAQGQTHLDNRTAREEIRRLMDGIQDEWEGIKRQYRQDALSYNQVLQNLQALLRKVRLTQVPIDESHVLDVNGRVIPYR
jgi:DNA repair exonuclease SbcCD ATPase subunit